MSQPTLIHLPYSPWSQKARWALDHHGIAYRTQKYLPMLGEPYLRWRTGRWRRRATVPVLAYDSARVFCEALRRCDGVLTGWGVKQGLERTRFAPSATGGPRTHIGASPEDHNLFHGDWLLYRRVVESDDGRAAWTVFEGLWQPNV